MTKIDIKETEGGGTNPEIIDNKMSDKNREGVSNESGYFEDDDESGAGLNQEDSIEIIFDKNASNNNSANSSDSAGRGDVTLFFSSLPLCNMNAQIRPILSLISTAQTQTAGWPAEWWLDFLP